MLLDADYLRGRNPPCMRLFIKTGGEVVPVLDGNFRHYFYVLSDDPFDLFLRSAEGDVDSLCFD